MPTQSRGHGTHTLVSLIVQASLLSTSRPRLSLWFTFAIRRLPSRGQCRVSALGHFLHSQQRARPNPLVFAHPPLINHPDRHSIERIDPLPSILASHDERRLSQHIEVLHHGKTRQVWKLLYDRSCRLRTRAEEIEDRPPRFVGQRFPDLVEVVRHVRIFHVVKN